MVNSKKLKIQMNGRSDEFFTPEYALKPLLPFLKKNWTIWECAWGGGTLAKHLKNKGFDVKGYKSHNFLEHGFPSFDFNCIITNPPYSKKEEFLRCAYAYGKPFALLMPLTALEGIKRGALFSKHGIQLIIPNRRINFITPPGKEASGAWFQVGWFCWKMNLPKDIMFVELNREGQS
jgi:hypothetical protein